MKFTGMAPGTNAYRAHPENQTYLYLLRAVAVVQPNQVWCSDWNSRCALLWHFSDSMDGRVRAFDNIFAEQLWRILTNPWLEN